jgi:hypothetical protein
MSKVQTNCPRCKSPVVAEVEQLFDLNDDPMAKQRFLSGQFNAIHCPTCGYDGMVGTPIIYHDPEKELLLTFVPPEMGLPVNEQERMIGPLINQVVNRLPAEKRKGYLFRPQSMLTFQTMIERVLEADGISKEMIEEQQKRLNLLQRLLTISKPESRSEVIKQEEALIDQNFFLMLSRLIEASLAQGDERTTQVLNIIQNELVEQTEIGKQIQEQSKESQEAVRSLQEASQKGLTREILLDLIIAAANSEIRLSTMVSLTRNGMDYQFFQLLSDKIDAASGEDKTNLEKLREKLLDYTSKIDQQVQQHIEESRKLLTQILSASDIEAALQEHIGDIDEFFVNLIEQQLSSARENADLDLISKLQKVKAFIEKASAPPPELEFIEQLLGMENYDDRMKAMQEKADIVTPEFLQLLSGLINQMESQKQSVELINRLKEINRIALRVTMMAAMKADDKK